MKTKFEDGIFKTDHSSLPKLWKPFFDKEDNKVRRKLDNLYLNIDFPSTEDEKEDIEDAIYYLNQLSFQKRSDAYAELFVVLEAYLVVKEMIRRVGENRTKEDIGLQKLFEELRRINERKDELIQKITNPQPKDHL